MLTQLFGQVYFVDHNSRTTQFTDPRLNSQILNNILKRVTPQAVQAPASNAAVSLSVSTATTTTAPASASVVNNVVAAAPQNPAPVSPRPRIYEDLPQVKFDLR